MVAWFCASITNGIEKKKKNKNEVKEEKEKDLFINFQYSLFYIVFYLRCDFSVFKMNYLMLSSPPDKNKTKKYLEIKKREI